MNRLSLILGVLSGVVVLGSVSSAHAEGFELGARLGYGIPLGKAVDRGTNNDLSDGVKGMIPLQLDLGYRVTPNLMVGGYFMYGFGILPSDISSSCDRANADCSIHDIRLGIQAQYHFMPEENVDPWVGAGIGYEWLGLGIDASVGGTTIKSSSSIHGWEFISLQGGADFAVAPQFGLGPFLSLSIAQYGTSTTSCSGTGCEPGDSASRDIDEKALHQWLTLGVRGTFVL